MTTTTTTTRRLATVETIADIAPIDGADQIVRARVRGWDVVVKKGEFAVGDLAVYFEVDSMLDVTDPRFEFLAPRGVRTDVDGNTGHVLKTAKLRGQYSQGLALPLHLFPELVYGNMRPGDDVTGLLGIRIWAPPIPANLSGQVRGPKPSWFPTTDEERIQNLPGILQASALWVATEKIDGTSMSVYVDGLDDVGVCGRNWDIAESDGNTLWGLARRYELHSYITAEWPGKRVAVQGEAYGEGIQGNPLKLRGHYFSAYALHVDGREVPRGDWPEWLRILSVPVRTMAYPTTVDEALAQVDGLQSALAPRPAEGVVWRAADGASVQLPDGTRTRGSFKVVSNRYLLKHDR